MPRSRAANFAPLWCFHAWRVNMPGLLVISVVLFLSASENLRVAVTVPPQARSMTIPVSMKLPNSPALKSGMQWQLSEGLVHIPAQVEGASLRFLLPVSASKAEVRRTLVLEQVSGDNKPMFTLKEAEAKYLRVFEGDMPVLTYNFGMILKPGVPEDRRRSSYVHPLYAPDGTLLTDDFPADHLHHRGLSWMWPNVEVGAEHHSLWDIRGIK